MNRDENGLEASRIPRGSVPEVFTVFLRLGCIAFGGPVAHLGYFREELVRKRKWVTDEEYADLVALCQFLPGPASSQVGFALGKKRAGTSGAFAAWVGFTLPSAVLMIAFAFGLGAMGDISGSGWITGLKLAAVAVVANAVWGMGLKLCPDRYRITLALATAAFLLTVRDPLFQIGVIALGALFGWLRYRNESSPKEETLPPTSSTTRNSKTFGAVCFGAFVILLLTLPLAERILPDNGALALTAGFYQAGSLVFGGGHVVLPLLESVTVAKGYLSQDAFLAGYGAAQALPGPLFAFSAFLGTLSDTGPGGISGGTVGLLAVYLPSWLLVLGILPYWDRLRTIGGVQAALTGANAAVVGLLLAALYNPIWVSSVTGPGHAAFGLTAFLLLKTWHCPPWLLALGCAVVGGLCFGF